jgi:hypothetical protein
LAKAETFKSSINFSPKGFHLVNRIPLCHNRVPPFLINAASARRKVSHGWKLVKAGSQQKGEANGFSLLHFASKKKGA